MAGGDPAPVPLDVSQDLHHDGEGVGGGGGDLPQDQTFSSASFRDRSVSEIETSFSEHFIPTMEEEEVEGEGLSSEYSGDFSSSELNTLPGCPPQPPAVQSYEGAMIDSPSVPYHSNNNSECSLVPSAITDQEESQSTKIVELNKISFKRPWLPVFEKKSFESDSLLGLTTESGSESLNCDSTIETEANIVADNIFQDNIENCPDSEPGRDEDTFLVSAKSDQVFTVKDFAFDNQENFFDINESLQIPLDSTKNQSLDIPFNQPFSSQLFKSPRSSKTFEDLSLIEEITEHSSLSTIKSRELSVSPRTDEDQSLSQCNQNQSRESPGPSLAPRESKLINLLKKSHKPKILQKTLSLDSPRGVSTKIGKVGSDLDQKLPSKSNPVTPREDSNAGSERKSIFAQSKPKIVSRRFQRSPPRDSRTVTPPSVPKPIQTKTGLTVTQPQPQPGRCQESLSRSASSASLILRSSGQPLRRQISKSIDNVHSGTAGPVRNRKYQHVGSKVKRYIEDIKSASKINTSSRSESGSRESSKSCLTINKRSKSEEKDFFENRPKTADATIMRLEPSEGGEDREERVNQITIGKLRKSISKSESNLKRTKSGAPSSSLSKSTFSVGQLGSFCESSEEEDLTELTAIYNGDNASIKAESLLELVAKERKSKQEAKKVITELQTSFDDLLQKYAAAENALDKARFGIKPLEDGRPDTFALAEKVAEKIACFELEEKREEMKKLDKLKLKSKSSIAEAREKIIYISNQVSGLAMSVSCGLTQSPEATMAALKAEQELQEVAVEFDCERNTELATLYLEARSKLEELKTQLKKQTKKEDLSNDLQLVTGEDERETPSFIASIRKVSDWQKSIPSPPAPLSSCYGSLPASPTSPTNRSQDVSQFSSSNNITNKTLEADSGCPGSDRSTLWFSYLHSKRQSPSTRSNSKSKENISTVLYNLAEENQSPRSPGKQAALEQEEKMAVTPRDILSINNQFVQSITIQTFDTPQDPASKFPVTSTPHDGEPYQYVTDLSDDEYEMMSAMKVNEGKTDEVEEVPQTPARSLNKLKACKSLFPGVESEALAQQIDHEILELRNFFDDHREEMLYLLHGQGEEGERVNQSLPGLPGQSGPRCEEKTRPQSLSLINIGGREGEGGSPAGLPDPSHFSPTGSSSLSPPAPPQVWPPGWPDSESDGLQPTLLIRKAEFQARRRRRRERQRRRVVTSSTERERERTIHSYFPVVRSGSVAVSHTRQEEEAGGGSDYDHVPRLNLSDLTSEITAPDMSLISEEFSLANGNNNRHFLHYEEPDNGQKTCRSIACDTLDLVHHQTKYPTSTQTTPGKNDHHHSRAFSSSEALGVNQSLPIFPISEVDPALVDSQKLIIINQTNCDHKLNKKKKKKKSKELRDLLNSLESAATIAEKLKKRSEDLLSAIAID